MAIDDSDPIQTRMVMTIAVSATIKMRSKSETGDVILGHLNERDPQPPFKVFSHLVAGTQTNTGS